MPSSSAAERELLRHALATIAYRASRAVLDAPASYSTLALSPTTRTPAQIVAHMGDLMDWALSMARDAEAWRTAAPSPWDAEIDRLFSTLERFDAYLATDAPLGCPPTKLLQGPIADALTHVGQLTMLRRVSGAPVRGEHYGAADIHVGRVGRHRDPPRVAID
jgi:hypothetical protein